MDGQPNPFTSPLPVQLNTDNAAGDAFGRLRTSSPTTLFDTNSQYDASPLFIERVLTGGGTSAHLPNESSILFTVGTASGDKVLGQTREYFRYTPGKSQMIIQSRVMGIPKLNTRQRIGYFDDNNGFYFENDGSTFGVVQRSFVTGSVINNRVAQSAFNLDKLDGTGSSGLTIDLSKANIFIIDFQWLGAGRVRFGVDIDGVVTYCHELLNANHLTTSYMTTGCLPMRAELENTGTSATPTTMKIICSSVIVEDGSLIASGVQSSVNNGITAIPVTTRRSILTIRPKATFNSIVNRAKVSEFDFEVKVDADALYEIVYNGVLGGTPSWTSAGASSTVEYDKAGTTVTGGIVLASGYLGVSFKGTSNIGKNLVSKLPFCLDIAGANPTNISIVITSFSGTSNATGSMTWKEIY
jgi:hypothetical protein